MKLTIIRMALGHHVEHCNRLVIFALRIGQRALDQSIAGTLGPRSGLPVLRRALFVSPLFRLDASLSGVYSRICDDTKTWR